MIKFTKKKKKELKRRGKKDKELLIIIPQTHFLKSSKCPHICFFSSYNPTRWARVSASLFFSSSPAPIPTFILSHTTHTLQNVFRQMAKLKSGKIFWLKPSSSPAQMSWTKPGRCGGGEGQELEEGGAELPPYTSPSSGDWAKSPSEETYVLLFRSSQREKVDVTHTHTSGTMQVLITFNCT